MSPTDPMEAAAGAKRAAAMLREARALQRRLDKLAGAADVPGRGGPHHVPPSLEQEVGILPLLTSSALRLPHSVPLSTVRRNGTRSSVSTASPFDVVAEAERHADTYKHLAHLTEDFTYDAWPAPKTSKATIAKTG